MQKLCTYCGVERHGEKDFRWEYKDRGIRMARCRYCQSELSKLHYQNNKQIYKNRSRIRKTQILSENKLRLYTYLSTHSCVDCAQADIRLLEFDHVFGQKGGEISDMLRQGCSWSRIEAEIVRCEVRCANCHRLKTFASSKSWRNLEYNQQHTENYQKMYIYLSIHSCTDCNETDIRVLEFDHVQNSKRTTISRLLTQGYSWSSIETEIAKCEVCCANCHRIRTAERDDD